MEGVEGQHAAACDMGRYDDCHTRVVCTFCMPLQVRNSVVPIPVHLDLAAPLRPQLDAACDEAHRQGHNVRALLFTRWGGDKVWVCGCVGEGARVSRHMV